MRFQEGQGRCVETDNFLQVYSLADQPRRFCIANHPNNKNIDMILGEMQDIRLSSLKTLWNSLVGFPVVRSWNRLPKWLNSLKQQLGHISCIPFSTANLFAWKNTPSPHTPEQTHTHTHPIQIRPIWISLPLSGPGHCPSHIRVAGYCLGASTKESSTRAMKKWALHETETDELHLKTDGWNLEYDCFLLGFGLFSGAMLISFREG